MRYVGQICSIYLSRLLETSVDVNGLGSYLLSMLHLKVRILIASRVMRTRQGLSKY